MNRRPLWTNIEEKSMPKDEKNKKEMAWTIQFNT
jgi:hypothetical protein